MNFFKKLFGRREKNDSINRSKDSEVLTDSEIINLYRNRFKRSLIGKWTSAEGTFPMMFDEFFFNPDGKGTWLSGSGSREYQTKFEWREKADLVIEIREEEENWVEINYDFRVIGRGGKGIIGIVNSKRNGNVSSSFPVNEGDEILISTNKGRVIRCAVKEIRIAGRNTQGVRIFKLSGEEKVVSAIKIDDNFN